MELKDFAKMLNGREYGEEISPEIENIAEKHGFVIIFGQSDDLLEVEGALKEEISAYDGGEVYFSKGDVVVSQCENEDCPHEQSIIDQAKKVTALWNKHATAMWSYETEIPHEKFMIKEDGEDACEGIVFHVSSIM